MKLRKQAKTAEAPPDIFPALFSFWMLVWVSAFLTQKQKTQINTA
jgi:hypothetical protein